jgi:hypothetical protein
VAQFFTVDVLSKIAFGKAFGCLPSGTDMYEYIKTSHEFIPILELKLNHPWINAITSTAFFRMLVAPRIEDKTGMGKVMGYVCHGIRLSLKHTNLTQNCEEHR